MRRLILAFLVLAGPLANGLHAQRLSGTRFPSIDESGPKRSPAANVLPHREVPAGWLATGGILGGAAGVLGGALVGAKLTENDCEDCGLAGAIYGAVAGGSALLPLGVHLANGRKGNYGASLLGSLAIGAVGLAVAEAANSGEVMIAVPVLQIVSSIVIERKTQHAPTYDDGR